VVTCALCGHDYDETAMSCRGRCPLASATGCDLLCCPYCGYQTVDERQSAAARLLRRLWPAVSAAHEATQVTDGDDAA
jgi:hypothetical protein